MKKTNTQVPMKTKIREGFFRAWYWYRNKVDKNSDILLMNYGYHDLDNEIKLDKNYEADRFSIQLYHHLANEAELNNKDIIEIGCGRGGGLHYITKNFAPASAHGVDLDKQAVSFCKRFYNMDCLEFSQGDAQRLKIKDNSCDVVINVESSHRYPDMRAFLAEVSRILRPKGYLLLTDFRYDYEYDDLKNDLDKSGLILKKEKFINKEVLTALELDHDRKCHLVHKLAPKFLHKFALNFAGAIGSDTYNHIASNKYYYFTYVLQKN